MVVLVSILTNRVLGLPLLQLLTSACYLLLFGDSSSNLNESISHCDFHLCFPEVLWYGASFAYTDGSFVYLLLRNVCRFIVHLQIRLWWLFLLMSSLDRLEVNSYQMHNLQMFSLILWADSALLFPSQYRQDWMRSHFPIFGFVSCALGVLIWKKKILAQSNSMKHISFTFSSGSFILLSLTSTSLIYFGFIFVYINSELVVLILEKRKFPCKIASWFSLRLAL